MAAAPGAATSDASIDAAATDAVSRTFRCGSMLLPSAARVAVAPPTYRFSAPVVAARAIDQAGQVTELDLAETTDLNAPLSLPPGTVDVELDLGGPLVLRASHRAGLAARDLDVSTLLVAIDEPESLDDLPEIIVDLEVAGALSAATDHEAATMIQDGALGLAR